MRAGPRGRAGVRLTDAAQGETDGGASQSLGADAPRTPPRAWGDPWDAITDDQRMCITRMLEGATIGSIARENAWARDRIDKWMKDPTFREARERRSRDLTRERMDRLRRVFDLTVAYTEGVLEREPAADAPPEERAALIDARTKMADRVWSRLKPFDVADLANAGGAGGLTTEEAWERQMLEPQKVFRPHAKQLEAIRALERFIVMVAGVQSGKTTGAAIVFWKRLREWVMAHPAQEGQRRGFFWLIAPNSIVGEVMCERFEEMAPPGWIVGREGQKGDRTWTLRDGSRVQFRSGEHADKLVARTLDGFWLDEFTLLKSDVWLTSVRQRLAATGGWGVFSGTPRGRNWAWEHIWRRTDPKDDAYDPSFLGFTWHSVENPMVPRDEVEAARRQLPRAMFEREWEASWEAFKGQVYDGWGDHLLVDQVHERDKLPRGTITVMGVDWGYASAGAVVVARKLPGGVWEVVEEVHEVGKLPKWWHEKIAELWTKHRVHRIWCDPEDAGRIATLQDDGLPVMSAANDVRDGIREVAAVIVQRAIRVHRRCVNLVQQMAGYHWKEQRTTGETMEVPVKANDHTCDALRYAIFSENRFTLAPAVRAGYRKSVA